MWSVPFISGELAEFCRQFLNKVFLQIQQGFAGFQTTPDYRPFPLAKFTQFPKF